MFIFHSYSLLNFKIMFRYKILPKNFRIKKSKTGNDSSPVNFLSTLSPSVQCDTFFRNSEQKNILKTSMLCRKHPSVISNERYMSLASDSVCWKCKANLNVKSFTCSSCGALQPPKPKLNFFELLGISQTYDINLEDMTKKFRDLQMIFHPDKVTKKSKEELDISEIYSRLLNKAYKTLKNPVSRGFYLLESSQIPSDSSHSLESKFLSTIMEKNEELETLDNLNQLMKLMEDNNEQIEKHYASVKMAFQKNKLLDANINLLKLNYLINLDKKMKEKEMKLKSLTDG